MQTNILTFIGYSLIVAVVINLIKNNKYKRIFILIASSIFYIINDYKYFIILVLFTIFSYLISTKLTPSTANNKTISPNKCWLFISISPIIIFLLFFKWHNYIPNNINNINNIDKLIMPLGFSYYSFKIISYLVEVYTDKYKREESFIDYFNYVSFFPQILCGPIARVEELSMQIKNLKKPRHDQMEYGIYLILSGLFKKIVIADRVSNYVQTIFSSPTSYPGIALWTAAFLYTIEIYCDFAGYSEIVIGICNSMGIYCSPNFKLPYLSYSITDFWRRWHISLSSWLKDYIYIPLGGNRRGKIRKIINVLITFIISGIWHGEGLTFIIWGLWHGILNNIYITESKNKFIRLLQALLTFIAVMFGWIMFNSSSVINGFTFIKLMFINFNTSLNSIIAAVLPFTNDYSCLAYVIVIIELILILLIMEIIDYKKSNLEQYSYNIKKCPQISYKRIILFICCIILLGTWGQNSFIYANF